MVARDNGRPCTEAEDDHALGRNQWLMGGLGWAETGAGEDAAVRARGDD